VDNAEGMTMKTVVTASMMTEDMMTATEWQWQWMTNKNDNSIVIHGSQYSCSHMNKACQFSGLHGIRWAFQL